MNRKLLAFLVAPLWVPFGILLLLSFGSLWATPGVEQFNAHIAIFSSFLAYVVTAIVLPVFLIVGANRFAWLLAGSLGFACGMLVPYGLWLGVLLVSGYTLDYANSEALKALRERPDLLLLPGLLGVLVGLTACAILRPLLLRSKT